MIGDPTCGMSGAVEDRPENQGLLNELVYFERAVRQQPVIANRGAEASECKE